MAAGRQSWILRAWLAMPDWVFRLLGVAFFTGYLYAHADEYAAFPRVGPYVQTKQGIVYFPVARVLTDVTFLLIALAFVIRTTPRQRAARAREIVIPMVGGFWPLLPFLILAAMKGLDLPAAESLERLLGFGWISWTRFYTGVTMLSVGMAIDVWAYAYLVRSLSIVAEARQLKTSGPYRFVRHPIYLGQFIAQGGYWLVLVDRRDLWAAFFVCFVAMQLYRSWVEEKVLEEALGDEYRAYRRRAVWFW